jgi:hypothetical protein
VALSDDERPSPSSSSRLTSADQLVELMATEGLIGASPERADRGMHGYCCAGRRAAGLAALSDQ